MLVSEPVEIILDAQAKFETKEVELLTPKPKIKDLTCYNCNHKKLKLTKVYEKNPTDFFCKLCGFQINKANYIRMCETCNSDYATCVNCLPCPNRHKTVTCVDVTQHGKHSETSAYRKNQYFCNVCSCRRFVRPYIFRCNPCEFDFCPHHAYRGNQAYGVNKQWQTSKIEEFEIEDPFWEKYKRIAVSDGVPIEEQETKYYSLGVDKKTGEKPKEPLTV